MQEFTIVWSPLSGHAGAHHRLVILCLIRQKLTIVSISPVWSGKCSPSFRSHVSDQAGVHRRSDLPCLIRQEFTIVPTSCVWSCAGVHHRPDLMCQFRQEFTIVPTSCVWSGRSSPSFRCPSYESDGFQTSPKESKEIFTSRQVDILPHAPVVTPYTCIYPMHLYLPHAPIFTPWTCI